MELQGRRSRFRERHGASDLIIGKLIDHGRDSYRFDPRESLSYFIELGTSEGKRTIWGKDLERAMKQSLTQPQIGDEVAMRRTGADRVTVQRRDRDADGRVIAEREVGASRNRWVVEKREFFEARAAAAGVLRDPNIDRRQAVRQHPQLVGTYLQLHAAQLAARRKEARPFGSGEVEQVRRDVSTSQNQIVPLNRVCALAGLARSSLYFARKAATR